MKNPSAGVDFLLYPGQKGFGFFQIVEKGIAHPVVTCVGSHEYLGLVGAFSPKLIDQADGLGFILECTHHQEIGFLSGDRLCRCLGCSGLS